MNDQPPTADDKLPVDTTGWSPNGTNRWRNQRGGELQIVTSSVNYVEVPKIDLFRNNMRRELLSRDGGLVSADLSTKGVGIVIAKFPQQPSGMTYEGMLLVVRNRTEHRVIVRFPETGITGVRDTAILMRHMKDLPDDADPMDGWMSDPYDRTRNDPLMRNVADDAQYDSTAPDHPLTLVRAELQRLERSL